ncbi:MAG: YdeI/OmpD-associated family protein [Candidatus Cloacimonetes bacterium]|nr:YdeI/OmpD-associated family protein [Candidatus Cloacimonadota bacterium]
MREYKFDAMIRASEIGSGGAYIEFPYNVEKEFGTKGRVKVVCFYEDIEYRGSLVKMGTKCHIIGITKQIRSKIRKSIGDKIEVRIYKDESERKVDIHPLLIQEFIRDKLIKENYEKLSYTGKKEIFKELSNAKKDVTKKRRLKKIILKLMK